VNELSTAGRELAVWAQAHVVVAALGSVVVFAPVIACWWVMHRMMAASHSGVHEIERRLSQLSSAVELLTDTTECGLQAAFSEIQHLTKTGVQRTTKQPGLQTRVRRAAGKGRSTRDIAVTEGVSEGEVRLRLTLAGSPSPVAGTVQ
jgi:hypothetical protein